MNPFNEIMGIQDASLLQILKYVVTFTGNAVAIEFRLKNVIYANYAIRFTEMVCMTYIKSDLRQKMVAIHPDQIKSIWLKLLQ